MRKVITPLPIQLGNITSGTNNLAVYFSAKKLLGGNPNPADGTKITTGDNAWHDLSGNNNSAYQGTALNQPEFKTTLANNRPTVLFDGDLSNLGIGSSSTINNLFRGGSVFLAVIKPTTTGKNSEGRLFSHGGANCYSNLQSASGNTCKLSFSKKFNTSNGVWTTTNRDINLGAVNIVVIYYADDNTSNDPIFYINSKTPVAITEETTPSGSRSDANGLQVGNSVFTTRTFDGGISEFIFLRSNHNTGQIGNLIDWAATEYGVNLL